MSDDTTVLRHVKPHGDLPCELALMVAYGMSPTQAIRAATSNAPGEIYFDDRDSTRNPPCTHQ
jgi:hypothetical protein